jgi:uncharacterized protein (UPF0261 family)
VDFPYNLSLLFKTTARPAMLGIKKKTPIKHAEMKMLRWAGGVTRLDRVVRNVYVRGCFKVVPITEKITENWL